MSLGLEDGRVGSFLVEYERNSTARCEFAMEPSVTEEPWFVLANGAGPVTAVSYGDSGAGRVIVAKRGVGPASSVSVLRLGMKRGLVGKGKLSLVEEKDITSA